MISKQKSVKVRKPIARKAEFCVYIVRCKSGTFYTGSTNNIQKRIKLHNSGHGAKYLKGKGPVELAYLKEYRYYKSVLNAEREIKKLSRAQKEKLVEKYKKKGK